MRYLLDTHIFIWWMEKNKRLTDKLMNLINDPQNKVFLPVVTAWEIVIKNARGKLKTPKDIEGGIKNSRFIILPMELTHVLEVGKLSLHHNDPFDRIIVSQARVEALTLITSDPKIWKYKTPIIKV